MNIIKKTNDQRLTGDRSAFTLIELLVVISVIAVLAAFTLPVIGAIKKREFINSTQAQMNLIVTALESYKADHGFYPPCNPNNAFTNQLYYELVGVTNSGTAAAPIYQPLDGSSTVLPSDLSTYFGSGGIVNCTQGTGEDAKRAKSYLLDLKPGQTATNVTGVKILVASVNGPDAPYQPLTLFTTGTDNHANPFRYVYPGTNNPGSYDLWVQLSIGSSFNASAAPNNVATPKNYLICNWSKQIQVNYPLP